MAKLFFATEIKTMPRRMLFSISLIFLYSVFLKAAKKTIQTYTLIYQTLIGYQGSFGCTEDYSGHDAWYRWAEDHAIDNPDDCEGNSVSFIEGCREFAEENN